MKISTVDKITQLESVKKNQKHGPDSHSIWHMVINFLPGIVVSM